MTCAPNHKLQASDYQVIFSSEQIRQRVAELGHLISRDYQARDLVLVAMLKGSLYFMADLSRAIDLPLSLDLIGISSLGRASYETGIVRVTKDLSLDIQGKDVLVVEDIVRSGLTTNYMIQYLAKRKPKTLQVVTFLTNPSQQLIDLPLAYTGFEIGYDRLVGYGLDYREQDRHLPFIASLDKGRYL